MYVIFLSNRETLFVKLYALTKHTLAELIHSSFQLICCIATHHGAQNNNSPVLCHGGD